MYPLVVEEEEVGHFFPFSKLKKGGKNSELMSMSLFL